MTLFSNEIKKYDIPYRDREEFLSQFVVLSDLSLLEKLEAFAPLGEIQAAEKKLYSKWLSAKLPEEFPAKEDMLREIESRTEMSNAAGVNLGIPTMLSNIADEADGDGLQKLLLGNEYKKIKDVAARVLLLSACMRADERYEKLARLLCGRDAMTELRLGDLIRICSEDALNELETELAVLTGILSIFFLGATVLTDNPLSAPAKCDDRLYGAINGNDGFLPEWIERIDPVNQTDEVRFRDSLVGRIVAGCEDAGRITVISGDTGAGKKTIVLRAADEIGSKVVSCFIGDLISVSGAGADQSEKTYSADYNAVQRRLLNARRECMLTDSILLIQGLESGCESILNSVAAFVRSQLSGYISTIFIAYNSEKEPTVPSYVYPEHIEDLSNRQRIELWKEFIDPELNVDNRDLEETGATFTFTPGQIREATQRLKTYGIKNPDRKLLHKACYGVLNGNLSSKATLVESGFTWDDVKLYPKEKCLLRDICDAVENRPKVMQDWNFKTKMPYGAGITVLFAGPPGTGKTMSATVIANELGMELYKVDSSRLIDKYVGETEKNIRAIFNLASHSNAILFFDEADAIFNKRMDAKDANERFANIESSLLLQCIEEYNGVVILATNKMSAMDPAFMRRFRFYVQFAEPGEDIAYEIWSSVFPKEAPLADGIDFRELAHVFKITGAVIKNIALQAAYQAAGRDEAINMIHILKAARREMEKHHKVITREELGRLSYLYHEMMED